MTLTDHYGGDTGGLQVVPGFHRNTEFFAKKKIVESAGEFYRMNDHSYDSVRSLLVTVQAPKGSLVCWDNRLPHATTKRLTGYDSREVVFTGFLPDTELNRMYVNEQASCMFRSLSPPSYGKLPVRAPDFNPTDLTQEQKQMLFN